MEYWNASVQGIRQVLDITREFIIHETRAESTECKFVIDSSSSTSKIVCLDLSVIVCLLGKSDI
jgi:hypothetical protein